MISAKAVAMKSSKVFMEERGNRGARGERALRCAPAAQAQRRAFLVLYISESPSLIKAPMVWWRFGSNSTNPWENEMS